MQSFQHLSNIVCLMAVMQCVYRVIWYMCRHGIFMMSTNRKVFRVTLHLCGESTDHSGFSSQWYNNLDFDASLLSVWTNCWINTRLAGILLTPCRSFPTQRPVTRSFDFFFDLRLNKRLGKQSWRRLFETVSRSLWRHCNGYVCEASQGVASTVCDGKPKPSSRFIKGYVCILDMQSHHWW